MTQLKETSHDLLLFFVLPLMVLAVGWFGYRTMASCDECSKLQIRFDDHQTVQARTETEIAEALKARELAQKASEMSLAAALRETNKQVQEQFSEINKTINRIDKAVVRIEAGLKVKEEK